MRTHRTTCGHEAIQQQPAQAIHVALVAAFRDAKPSELLREIRVHRVSGIDGMPGTEVWAIDVTLEDGRS